MVEDDNIISGTEAAYQWHATSTHGVQKPPAFDNPDQFWATINQTQKLLKELIDTFEDLKQMKGERSIQNSN